MSTLFPGNLDTLSSTRGSAGQPMDTPNHVTHHTNEDDAISALEAKVGVDGSAVATSLDYKVAHKQDLDATLTALAALDSSAGAIEQTGADTFTKRAIGTSANNLVALTAAAKLPAVDGSLLTNLPGGMTDPMTTRGDIVVRNAANATARLAVGANGTVLKSDGTDVAWGTVTGAGDVVGPATATDNALARFDTTTGKLLQNSLATADDSGSVNIPTGQKYKINGTALAAADVGAEASGAVSTHAALTATHGVSGAVVGTTDTQELTNKTLNASVGKGTWTASGTWTLPALTLGGAATFSENVALLMVASLSADGKYCGIVETGTAGETLAFGTLVYFKAADSRWWKTDADAATTSGPVKVGIVAVAAASAGNSVTVMLYGKIRADSLFPTLTIGAPAFVSGTAGEITVTAPTGTDSVTRIIGYGNTGDELFFNPDNSYMTHV